MNENEIITTLASLINNAGNRKKLHLDTAYQIYRDYSVLRCREATIKYYDNKYKVVKCVCMQLGIENTSDITRSNYCRIIDLLSRMNYSNASINKFCDLIKGMFNVCNQFDYIDDNPIRGIKKLKEKVPEIKLVNNDTKERIMNYLFNLKLTPINLRNICYFLIVNDTGARLNEMINIKTSNIKLDDNTIYLEYTKTGIPRNVYVQDITIKYIKDFLKYHNHKSEYFFINMETGEQLDKHSIYDVIEKVKKDLNITYSISPHKWRHALATELANKNMNINMMMKVLGHTQFSTTRKYIHQDDEMIKNEVLNILRK